MKQKKNDNSNLYTSCVAKFGGNYSNGDNTGVFNFNVNNTSSNSNANIGGHLLFQTFVVLSIYCPTSPTWVGT